VGWKRVGTVTTLTNGQLCKTDGQVIICDSTTPTISSGDVGIGTTSPINSLDISGAATIGASCAGIDLAPTNGLIVQGKVGIGTTVPTTGSVLDMGYTSSSMIMPKGGDGAKPGLRRDGSLQHGDEQFRAV
jgi:hypothetical protein